MGFRKTILLISIPVFAMLVGCSGQSGGNFVYNFPFPTELSISGSIDLSDVAVSPLLGGVQPSIRQSAIYPSFLDHRVFRIKAEDDPGVSGTADLEGKFALTGISPRDQIVLKVTNSEHPGFVLEWMTVSSVLIGPKQAKVTVYSTARSFIARFLRNRYGRRIDPELITDKQIAPVVNAITNILEKHPGLIADGTPLDKEASVYPLVAEAAAALDKAGSGEYPREWTFLVYQGGDNDLDALLRADIEEMKKANLSGKIAVLVQSDSPVTGLRRLFVEKGKETVLYKIQSSDSADALKIADFVAWGQRAFPAKRFALIMASHGLGWRSAAESRGVVTDDPADAVMNFVALKQALLYSITYYGSYVRPLDLIGFDACLMGLLEVAFQLKDTGKHLVFSQANEPAYGWGYESLFNRISSSPATLDGLALGKLMLEEYRNFYVSSGLDSRYSGTLSLVDLGKIANCVTAFQNWANLVSANISTVKGALLGIRDALAAATGTLTGPERFLVQAFEYTDYRDLIDLVTAFKSSFPQGNYLVDEIEDTVSAAVPATTRFGTKYLRAHGLSVSFPAPCDYTDYLGSSTAIPYSMLDFAKATSWDELLFSLNSSSATAKVDGRGMKITLSWNNPAPLDLYIGEPDSASPLDSNKAIWFSAVQGAQTPNGQFSPDVTKAELNAESWTAEPMIFPGKYWVFVHFPVNPSYAGVTNATLEVATLTSKVFSVSRNVSCPSLWEGLIVTVTRTGITVEEVPAPVIEENLARGIRRRLGLPEMR